MGRPRASNTTRDFAATFANTVSVTSTCQYDWIARTGKHGLFTLLSKLAPKVRSLDVNLRNIFMLNVLSRHVEFKATKILTGRISNHTDSRPHLMYRMIYSSI